MNGPSVEYAQGAWETLLAQRTNDAVVFADALRRVVWVNDSFMQMTGASLADVAGRPLDMVLRGSAGGAGVAAGVEGGPGWDGRSGQAGESAGSTSEFLFTYPRSEVLHVGKDGRHRLLTVETIALRDAAAAVTGFVAIAADVTAQRLAVDEVRALQTEVSVLHRLALVTARTLTDKEALQLSIDAVCEATGWPIGHVLVPDGEGSRELVSARIWHVSRGSVADHPCSAEALAEFRAASESVRFAFGADAELPGQVAAEHAGGPRWVRDVQVDGGFGRAEACRGLSLHAAVAFPIIADGELAAVLELFHQHPMELDPRLLRLSDVVAVQIGRALERRRAERRVAENEQRTRMIIDTALDAVVVMDASGVITDWNAQAERTFGFKREEAVGQRMEMLIMPDEFRGLHRCGLARYIATGEGRVLGKRIEVPALRKDGSRITVELAVNPVHAAGEERDGVRFSAFLRDITDRKRSEQELMDARAAAVQASIAKSEFLANMSHEIRTPMTSILGFAELLTEDGDITRAPETRREYLGTIKRHGNYLLAIINDILDISKIEAGKMTVERVPTSVVRTVEEVLSLMRLRSGSKGIGLLATYETPVPRSIASGPVRLRQVLINIVGNAIKFTEVGSVTLLIRVDSDLAGRPELRITVRDTGIGMNPQQVERAFGAFEQADASMTRRFGGTGLGLRISKRLVELLGGDISVQSEVGRGSAFTIAIGTGPLEGVEMVDPAAELVEARAARERATENKANAGATQLKGVRLMLAEDGPDNQRLISFHLKKAGAAVTIVGDGRKALQAMCLAGDEKAPLLSPPPFDLILMDMQMPEMDGYTAAAMLRSKGCLVPIIALTAHAMSADREKCLAAGCSGYATKPIDKATLIQTVIAALKQPSGTPPAG